MKSILSVSTGMMLLMAGSAFAGGAASTSTIYASGWLVLAFFGLCALVITVQLIPAIIMLAGLLKGLFSGKETVHERHVK